VPLTNHGHKQALEAGKLLRSFLKKDDSICFYTSPYLRARQTTDDIIKGLGDTDVDYVIHEEPRMREQDFGNFQSPKEEMQRIWVERAKYGHFFYRIPYGESAADVYDRCASFNATLFRHFAQDTFPSILVLVTHGIWARVFLMKWFRWSVEYFEDLQNVPHCTWIVMEKNPKTEKYCLNTHLQTWSELEDQQRAEKLKEDTSDELKLSSNRQLDDNEINTVADAVARAKDEQVKRSIETMRNYHSLFQDHKKKSGCSKHH